MGELKPGWRRVKFAQLAECINDRVDDPSKAGVDRYVGLDHLDPESLKIRRWGTPDEVESTKLRFRPGDIIFGKRRAYQRKLAVADFEGICSAHAMVLRAKPAVVLPEFLPFLMQSDTFMERAVEISVGSLSPTINWKTLAAEEFVLPPLEEQNRVVPILYAANRVVETARELLRHSQVTFRVALDCAFGFPNVPRAAAIKPLPGWTVRRLEELVDPARAIAYGILMPGPPTPGGVPMLRVMDFDEYGRREATTVLQVDRSVADTSRTTYVREGDLLVSVMATIGRSFVVPPEMAGWNVNRALTLVPTRSRQTAEFLDAYFQSGFVRRLLDIDKIGSAQARINLSDLRKLPVPVPLHGDLSCVTNVRDHVVQMVASAEARVIESLSVSAKIGSAVMGIK